jgi:hypothetical protein
MFKPSFAKTRRGLKKIFSSFKKSQTQTSLIKISSSVREKKDRRIKFVALMPHFAPDESFFSRRRAPTARTPSIVQLMKHCQANKYTRELIVRVQQGFVIDKEHLPKSLKGYLDSKLELVHGRRSSIQTNLERVRVIHQLAELGFKVVVPRYIEMGKEEPTSIYPKLRKDAKTFPVKRMLRFGMPYVDDLYPGKFPLQKDVVPANNYWARDIYKKVGKERLKFVANSTSALGEGGLSVDINSTAFFAYPRLKEDYAVQKLIGKGNKVYFLEEKGNRYSPGLSRAFKTKVFLKSTHVDLFLGVVGKTLLIDPFFLKENQGVVQQAVREQQLRIVQIPSSEIIFHPANFLVLGENEVLLEKRAIKTRRALEQAGIKVHSTIVPLKSNLEYGGGVRCIVNEV